MALVAGRNLVPRPATGNMALRIFCIDWWVLPDCVRKFSDPFNSLARIAGVILCQRRRIVECFTGACENDSNLIQRESAYDAIAYVLVAGVPGCCDPGCV